MKQSIYILLIFLLICSCDKIDDEIAGTYTWSYTVSRTYRSESKLFIAGQYEHEYELILKKSGKGVLLMDGEKVRTIPKDSMVYNVSDGFLHTSIVPFNSGYTQYTNCFYKGDLDCSKSATLIGTYEGVYKTNKYTEYGYPSPDYNGVPLKDTSFNEVALIKRYETENACICKMEFRGIKTILLPTIEQNSFMNLDYCNPLVFVYEDSLRVKRSSICSGNGISIPIYFDFRSKKTGSL